MGIVFLLIPDLVIGSLSWFFERDSSICFKKAKILVDIPSDRRTLKALGQFLSQIEGLCNTVCHSSSLTSL